MDLNLFVQINKFVNSVNRSLDSAEWVSIDSSYFFGLLSYDPGILSHFQKIEKHQFRRGPRGEVPLYVVPSLSILRIGFYDDFKETSKLLEMIWGMRGFNTIPYCRSSARSFLERALPTYFPDFYPSHAAQIAKYLCKTKGGNDVSHNLHEITEFVKEHLTPECSSKDLEHFKGVVFPKEDELIRRIEDIERIYDTTLIVPTIRKIEAGLGRKVPKAQSRELASVIAFSKKMLQYSSEYLAHPNIDNNGKITWTSHNLNDIS